MVDTEGTHELRSAKKNDRCIELCEKDDGCIEYWSVMKQNAGCIQILFNFPVPRPEFKTGNGEIKENFKSLQVMFAA